jgi:hypothetical protein
VLNENDDTALLAAETAAAMQDLARTVTTAPPLRLPPGATGLSGARSRRRPRFHWSWGAPLLAAVAMVALAVTLVIVKNLPDGQRVPSALATVAGEDALPDYYVAVNLTYGHPSVPDGLIVGDTRTGKIIATVAPPAHSTVVSVSAASDDRTFAVVTAPASGAPSLGAGFYLLTITPGRAPPAKLTKLPLASLDGVIATALSASGTELAVATATKRTAGGPVTRKLAVYSVATGRALRSWSTAADTSAIVSYLTPTVPPGRPTAQFPALAWIDGDRAIAFPVLVPAAQPWVGGVDVLSVRSIDVTAPGSDLMADSKVIVSLGDDAHVNVLCGTDYPVLSGDGSTLFCASAAGPDGQTSPATVRWVLRWEPRATSLANQAAWRFSAFGKTVDMPAVSGVTAAAVWSSSDGSTLLVEWSVARPLTPVKAVSFGEFTRGKNGWTFTPLPAPAVFAAGGAPPAIAW